MSTFGGETVTGVFAYTGSNTNANIHTVNSGKYARVYMRHLSSDVGATIDLLIASLVFARAEGSGGLSALAVPFLSKFGSSQVDAAASGSEVVAASGEVISASGNGAWSILVLEYNNP